MHYNISIIKIEEKKKRKIGIKFKSLEYTMVSIVLGSRWALIHRSVGGCEWKVWAWESSVCTEIDSLTK